MTAHRKTTPVMVEIGFEKTGVRLAMADIQPLRLVPPAVKNTTKYARIVSSIREVGIIEPPVVAHDKAEAGKFLLLDGHLRLEVLKDMGETTVECLVSTDDEAFTYNKRVNRLATIQEHKMILKAVEKGVPEERLAKALNIDVNTLRHKMHLLDGICPEAADILKDKHVSENDCIPPDRGGGIDACDEQIHDGIRSCLAGGDATIAARRNAQAEGREGTYGRADGAHGT
jgi:hypothetical protein